MSFSVKYFIQIFKVSLPYLKDTTLLAVASFVLAVVTALFLAIVIENRIKVLYPFSRVYVSFFRCTPIMSQLFFFYYGLAQVSEFFRTMPPKWALILVLGLNQAAFMSETIRGAFSSVPKTQKEACLACGMSQWQAMRRIILPQAIRVAVPGLSNSFIGVFKSTSLGFTIGVIELMTRAKMEATNLLRYLEGYSVILIIYWVVVAFFVLLQGRLEKKMNQMY